jgi:hypothetical protein
MQMVSEIPDEPEVYHWGTEERGGGKSRPVHAALTYVENPQARMTYAYARRRGLPVGSGNVEVPWKSPVALGLKRAGARWKDTTGEPLLNLRALALSERWETAMALTVRPLRKALRLAA